MNIFTQLQTPFVMMTHLDFDSVFSSYRGSAYGMFPELDLQFQIHHILASAWKLSLIYLMRPWNSKSLRAEGMILSELIPYDCLMIL